MSQPLLCEIPLRTCLVSQLDAYRRYPTGMPTPAIIYGGGGASFRVLIRLTASSTQLFVLSRQNTPMDRISVTSQSMQHAVLSQVAQNNGQYWPLYWLVIIGNVGDI